MIDRGGRQNRERPLSGQPALAHDPLQHRLGVRKDPSRLNTNDRIIKNRRIASRQIPDLKEGCPVNVGD